ncbi:MAG: uracil-DNA glycosylase [Candidatus Marinimicrobia bacterium]|nr:uracil-DNA glycosylase [Candidatus Neomarinimicrobiota bacterium]
MYSKKELQNCKLCELYKTRLNALVGEGNINSNIMLIAQAPGELEDKANKMFVGPSGKMLNKLLQHAQIPRNEIYITNLIKCNLPQNRRPKQKEIKACSKYLDMEITEIKPKILVPLGYYATKYIFEKNGLEEFSKKEFATLIGKIFITENYKIFPLSHPASILYHNEFIFKSLENFSKLKKMDKN